MAHRHLTKWTALLACLSTGLCLPEGMRSMIKQEATCLFTDSLGQCPWWLPPPGLVPACCIPGQHCWTSDVVPGWKLCCFVMWYGWSRVVLNTVMDRWVFVGSSVHGARGRDRATCVFRCAFRTRDIRVTPTCPRLPWASLEKMKDRSMFTLPLDALSCECMGPWNQNAS